MPLRIELAVAAVLTIAQLSCSGDDTRSPSGGGGDGGAGAGGPTGGSGPGGGGGVPVACRPGPAEPATPSGAPVAFWTSQPLRPDETAVVTAGNLDESATIEAAVVPDCDAGSPLEPVPYRLAYQKVTPIYASTSGTQFVVPAKWPAGVYAYKISAHGKTSARTFVNKPDVWFVQGDVGETATPGGWLQVHGTALGSAKASQAVLVQKGQIKKTLRPDPADKDNDDYRERFAVPADVPEGDYELYVHNGHGGALGWTRFATFVQAPLEKVTVAKRQPWPSKVFDVTKQAGADDDARFLAAIAAITANKGGVLYAPKGSYTLTKDLVLPDRTLVRGEGKDKTTLTWTADPAPATALIHGVLLGDPIHRATFSIEDIAITGSPTFLGNAVELAYAALPAWIRRSRITLPRVGTQGDAILAVFLETSTSVEITDSELDARGALFSREGVAYLRAERNVFDWRDLTAWWSSLDHGFIFANNTLNLRGNEAENGWNGNPNPGFAFTAFYGTRIGGPFTKDLYYGHNKSTSDQVQPTTGLINAAGYTSDGATGIYIGKFTSSGTTLTLAGTTTDPGIDASNDLPITFDFRGGIAMIVDGKGIGQWRYLTRAADRSSTVEIDRPWDVEPDATSTVNLLNLQGRSLFIGNDFSGEHTNQEFCSALDIIRADNQFPVGGSWTFIGAPYPWSTFVSPWHFQMLDNRFTTGPLSTSQDLVTITAFPSPNYAGVAGSGLVYRNNVYATPGTHSIGFYTKGQIIADSLMEKNVVGLLSLGQGDDQFAFEGMVMRKNTAMLTGNLNGKDPNSFEGIHYIP